MRRSLLTTLIVLALAACSGPPSQDLGTAATGPNPVLPPPQPSSVPTVNIAQVVAWKAGQQPRPGPGLQVQPFASGLDHPRWIHVLPNGDVLVAETNRQQRSPTTIRGMAQEQVLRAAGAGRASADRISLLRDADGDGVAETRRVLLDGLTSPFGMALVGNHLYVANTNALLRFPFRVGQTRITARGQLVVRLPAGPGNQHWTRGLALGPDGRLYVSVGSNSDHGENGMASERGRAAIWVVNPRSGAASVYASGLRNPVGLDFEPTTGQLWTVVNERDGLGNNLVPDYLTSVRAGGNYGWPWLYWGRYPDPRIKGASGTAIRPDYSLGSHVSPLGLTFADGAALGRRYLSGAFIGQHGSWNRVPAVGYSVVFVPFANGRPAGQPVEVLSKFLNGRGDARGRPVGVAIAGDGSLLVADDVGNTIWRLSRRQR